MEGFHQPDVPPYMFRKGRHVSLDHPPCERDPRKYGGRDGSAHSAYGPGYWTDFGNDISRLLQVYIIGHSIDTQN